MKTIPFVLLLALFLTSPRSAIADDQASGAYGLNDIRINYCWRPYLTTSGLSAMFPEMKDSEDWKQLEERFAEIEKSSKDLDRESDESFWKLRSKPEKVDLILKQIEESWNLAKLSQDTLTEYIDPLYKQRLIRMSIPELPSIFVDRLVLIDRFGMSEEQVEEYLALSKKRIRGFLADSVDGDTTPKSSFITIALGKCSDLISVQTRKQQERTFRLFLPQLDSFSKESLRTEFRYVASAELKDAIVNIDAPIEELVSKMKDDKE